MSSCPFVAAVGAETTTTPTALNIRWIRGLGSPLVSFWELASSIEFLGVPSQWLGDLGLRTGSENADLETSPKH